MDTSSIALLPIPRGMALRQGCFTLQPGDCISMDPGNKDLILPIAQKMQREVYDLAGVRMSLVIGGRTASRIAITFEHDKDIADEGYVLSISEEAISIRYSKPAGAFYATRTLKQIVRQRGRSLPAMQVDDEPDFPSRGFMVDIGRDKIPTMATLFRIVDLMADVKLNHLELYIEGSPFAYASYPFMWESETPITGEEIMELDRYCRDRFVELVPNQNSFGHMAPWLADRRLNHLAECPDGFAYHWGPMPPTTLDPNDPGSIDFIERLYDDLLPYFSSTLFNVGCDETWELGQGKSRKACEERGTGRVYLDYLLKIHDLVSERGKRMMFWGDIIGHYPELVPELPTDVIALEWGYEGEHPFEASCERFRDSGIPFYVCPGTSSWNSIAGRTDNMMKNLLNAARGGIATGAIGLLNTDWGDNGHWQYLPVSYAGLAYGAAVSWACEQNHSVDLASFLDRHVFLDERQVMGRFALDLGNYYLLQGKKTANSTVIFGILNSNLDNVRSVEGVTREALLKTRSYVEELESRLAQAEMKCDDADLVEAEFRNAIRFAKHGVDLGLLKIDLAGKASSGTGCQSETAETCVPRTERKTEAEMQTEAEVEAGAEVETEAEAELRARLQCMQDDIGCLIKNHRLLWLERNRPGGLDRSTRRLEGLHRQYMEQYSRETKW